MPSNESEPAWMRIGREVTNADEEPHKVAAEIKFQEAQARAAKRKNILNGTNDPEAMSPKRPLRKKLSDDGGSGLKSVS